MPGSIRRPMRRTPSRARSKRGRGRSPSACSAGNWATSCTTPATKTPIASTRPGFAKYGATNAGGHDHHDVEQRLVERGHRETPVAVQDAAAERDQRDEEHVGKREAQHLDRQLETAVAVVPARREQEGQHRRRDDAHQGDGEQDEAEDAGDARDQLADLGVGLLHLVLGDDRHEGLRERTLGGQAAHEVRDLERHQEGVHQGARAEGDQVDHVPDHARDPGEERQEANDRGIAQESVRHAAGTIAR